MAMTTETMSIGQFSVLTRISVRMLRHYDTHGVLVPQRVDPSTGYRQYGVDQVVIASRIRRLRDAGVGVAHMSHLLSIGPGPELSAALQRHRTVLLAEVDVAQQRLDALERLLAEQEESTMSTISVDLVELPAQTLVTLRGTIANYAAEGELWARFMPELGRQGITPIGGGGCIEHDGEYRESDVTESVFLPVAPGTEGAAPLAIVDLKARRAVVARTVGPYAEAITAAHEQIAKFIADNGLTVAYRADDVATHGFNIYENDPSQTAPEDLVTLVHMPVR